MPFWLILGLTLWLGSVLIAIALCRAAARGDKQLQIPPSPLADYFNGKGERVNRAMARFTLDHPDRERLGL